MKKRILAILLSLCLLVGLFPVTALAAEDTTPDETVTLLEGSETSPSYDWYTGAEENVTEYTISTAADLLGFANIVNGTAGEGNPAQDSFENKTVKLGADIALTEEWTPVNGFKGEFDGQGHTISNIWNDDAITKKGFFTSISYAYIHNLKLDGVNFSCTEAVSDAYIGSLACGGNTFSVVEDVTVSNVVIKYDNISNSDIGALCGEAYGYSQMRNVTLNNIKIDVQNSTDKYNYIGGFLGTVDNGNEADTFVIYDNCTAATKPFVGGDESTQSKVETVPAWYGDGTANEFYISNLEELKQFRDLVNSGVSFAGGAPDQDGKINGKHIYLTDDIDLSGEEWTPIGLNKDTAFGGHFYGQGHTISNLMVTQQTNYAGLFGYVRNYGNQYGGNDSIINYLAGIEDLTIHNVTIENATNAGAFAGILDQPADNNWYGGVLQLHNLKLTGNVVIKGTNAGGMFGGSWTEARINTTDLTVDVAEGSSVYGSAIAGGVFASSPHTDLASNIASNIDVSGDKIVGGIAGNAGWKWENVSSTGDVTLNSDTASETGYNVGTTFGMVIDNTYWKPNRRINMTALSGTGTLVVNVDGSSQNTNGHHGNLIGGDWTGDNQPSTEFVYTGIGIEAKKEKGVPALTITPSTTALTGGGTVILTVAGVPEGEIVTVTCDDTTCSLTDNQDGTYSVTLPDDTKIYTFTVIFSGNDAYNSARDTCTVTVYRPSSGSSSSSSRSYAVSVESGKNGDVVGRPKNASKGTTVTITVKPDAGYELDNLTVTDADVDEVKLKDKGDGKYTFTMPASKITVEATFVLESDAQPTQPTTHPFADIAAGSWINTAVQYVYANGLMTGNGSGTLAPKAGATRAETAAMLMRFCEANQ